MNFLSLIGGIAAGIVVAAIYWLSIKQGAAIPMSLGRVSAIGIGVGGMLIRLVSIGLLFFLLARWTRETYLTIVISFVACFTFLLMRELFVLMKPKT